MQLPIVFVGPSLPVEEARRFLEADYRRPIRRGDLTEIEPERVVGIIDGVFDQDLAVSPREVKSAIGRGVRVFGSSSMGALRAAEVPGVVGVGRVFEMFRSGALEDDDEVAITFDPDTHRPLCEPMVNVRYAVERLVTPGTISREAGSAIVRAAKALPYRDRTYPHILRSAGLGQRADAKVLQSMLSAHDLKREDAITLLEVLPRASQCKSEAVSVCLNDEDDRPDTIDNALTLPANAPVHCWEFGPPIAFEELTRLLMFTGELPKHARAAASRFLLQGNSLDGALDAGSETAPSPEQVGTRVLERLSAEWSFFTDEEARVSVADFGIGALSFEDCVDEEIAAERRVMALVREGSVEFQRALRMQLFLDDLALKRAAARCSSLTELAALVAPHELREQDRAAALVTICAALDVRDRGALVRELSWWGREPEELEQFVELLARARLAHQRRVTAKAKNRVRPLNGLGLLRRQLKPAGELRFSYPARLAARHIRRLCKVVGITRVSSITGLSDLGIPNAQAFRPDGQFSSTVGSGKSESVSGARIGAVMEEVEKWAQEQYALSAPAPARIASYTTLRAARRLVVDPRSLDLPYDTCYQPELDLQWHACHDLISGRPVLVPTAALTPERLPQDIYFSPRAARKQFSTNGLASGFNLEDALCHAMCEYIERHADVLHEIGMGNPGVRPEALATLIDPQSVPRSTTRLIRKIEASGRSVRLFDIRSDIRVPTFRARIGSALDGPEQLFGVGQQIAFGKATHPNPEVALNMALLEAVQSVMTVTAGAREDLTVRSRSLGRHERTTSMTRRAFAVRSGDAEAELMAFGSIAGLVSRDARRDIAWVVERVRDAGYPHVLVSELGPELIAPARVVRVLIPGLETVNPFHTGLEARTRLIADLLPRTSASVREPTSGGRRVRRAQRAPAR